MEPVAIIENPDELTPSEFNEKYYQTNTPVIFRGAAKNTEYFKKWTLEYIDEKVASREVNVHYCDGGNYDFTIEGRNQKRDIPFNKLIDLVNSKHEDEGTYYLQAGMIDDDFPELVDDLENPAWLMPQDVIKSRKFWVGEANCTTQLHYDTAPNFLIQVAGEKEAILYSPLNSPFLYPKSGEGVNHVSLVDIHNVDTERFPLFANAQQIKCVLQPGDIFYLPPGWWHQFTSLTPCINVNYWWWRFDAIDNVGIEYMDVPTMFHQVKIHLKYGFEVDHQVMEGDTILLKAIDKGFANMAEALLICGANPNVISRFYQPGASALVLATEQNKAQMVKLLLAHGAQDIDNAAAELAQQKGLDEILGLLNHAGEAREQQVESAS